MTFVDSVAVAAAWFLFAVPAIAQEEAPVSEAPASEVSAEAVIEAPPGDEPFGRIARADVTLRCFPTEISPSYGETLGEGDVVRITGVAQQGFVPVRMPLGVRGYVHKDFSAVDESGALHGTVSRLAFRYRPDSSEAPVDFVGEDAQFLAVGEEGEWWQVRYPAGQAWVAEQDIVGFPRGTGGEESLMAAWSDLQTRQVTEVAEFAEMTRLLAEAEAAEVERMALIAELRTRFRDESQKDPVEQSYAELRVEVQGVRDASAEERASYREAAVLLEEIDHHETVVAAVVLLNEPEQEGERFAPVDLKRDPLREYVTGFLRATGGMFGSKLQYELTKGGQVLFLVDCVGQRYDLSMFEGYEVALRGHARRPDPESLRVIDVERIQVLGQRRN